MGTRIVLAQIGVSVKVDGSQTPGSSLPITGMDIALLVAAAIVLIGAGWLLLRLGQRRTEVDR
jgi:hypothetical protein